MFHIKTQACVHLPTEVIGQPLEYEQDPDLSVRAILHWEDGAQSLLGMRKEEEKQREQQHRGLWSHISNTAFYQLHRMAPDIDTPFSPREDVITMNSLCTQEDVEAHGYHLISLRWLSC